MKIQYDLLQETQKKFPKKQYTQREKLIARYIRMGLDRFRAEQLANYNQ